MPYRLVIKSYDRIGPHAKAMADSCVNLFRELAAEMAVQWRFASKVNECDRLWLLKKSLHGGNCRNSVPRNVSRGRENRL